MRAAAKLIFKEDASFRVWPGFLGIFIGLALCFGYASFSIHKNASALEGAKYVSLSVDGVKAGVITRAENVQGLLASLGVSVQEGDSLNITLSSSIEDGDMIFLRRAITVFIKDNSAEGSLLSLRVSGGTVGDALSKNAENAGSAMISGAVSPDPSTPVRNGMVIQVDSVSKEVVTTTQEVPFSVVRQDDPSLLRGNEKIISEGANGEREITMQIVYVNGQEVSRAVISNIITQEATDKIISVGTKAPATPKPSPTPTKRPSATTARASSTPKPTATPGKTNALGSVDSASSTITVDGKTYKIAETRSMEITAYTHTGNKTATGKWPAVGMAAINTSEFSYGTKFYIPGYGLAVAEDTGVRGSDRIDVFMNTYDECIQWGRKRNYTVYVLE
ncbi:MAG: G5 domain-containing protein [Christensenellales bacterium]